MTIFSQITTSPAMYNYTYRTCKLLRFDMVSCISPVKPWVVKFLFPYAKDF